MALLSLIVARSENDVIGHNGGLPWRLRADLKRFKQLTLGHSVIMGRKTFESIGKPLPQRRNLVVTTQLDWQAEGVEVYHSFEAALAAVEGEDEAFLIGGGSLYELAMDKNLVDQVYETWVHAEVDGDTFFTFDPQSGWELVSVEACQADAQNDHAFTYRQWKRSAVATSSSH